MEYCILEYFIFDPSNFILYFKPLYKGDFQDSIKKRRRSKKCKVKRKEN